MWSPRTARHVAVIGTDVNRAEKIGRRRLTPAAYVFPQRFLGGRAFHAMPAQPARLLGEIFIHSDPALHTESLNSIPSSENAPL